MLRGSVTNAHFTPDASSTLAKPCKGGGNTLEYLRSGYACPCSHKHCSPTRKHQEEVKWKPPIASRWLSGFLVLASTTQPVYRMQPPNGLCGLIITVAILKVKNKQEKIRINWNALLCEKLIKRTWWGNIYWKVSCCCMFLCNKYNGTVVSSELTVFWQF